MTKENSLEVEGVVDADVIETPAARIYMNETALDRCIRSVVAPGSIEVAVVVKICPLVDMVDPAALQLKVEQPAPS